ncbi:MAG: deoxyribonuclease IV [Planctomycetia bacterium]|nr:deoxyribonuclease IV [Planctomycetia bacterium]
MPKIGAHQSISGGLEKAILISKDLGFDTVQIFSKNSNQWKGAPIKPEAAALFQKTLKETGISDPLIHDSYLINLASPKSDLLEKSIAAFTEELNRAAQLKIRYVVMHPGSCTTDTRENGLKRVADSFNTIFSSAAPDVHVLLETTAGQGTNLGNRFEELAFIIGECSFADRLGVCLDTCHVFAAGYDFSTRKKYEEMMEEFDRIIGIARLKAFHLNDSVKGCGSRVDRHEAIGYGMIGKEPFGFFLNDPRFKNHPMYLETPKGETEIDGKIFDWDTVNLKTLRNLIK